MNDLQQHLGLPLVEVAVERAHELHAPLGLDEGDDLGHDGLELVGDADALTSSTPSSASEGKKVRR